MDKKLSQRAAAKMDMKLAPTENFYHAKYSKL
jgi:hypothetical protein